MTKLKCDVAHCSSNEHGLCCRPEIRVSGNHAQGCVDTCCASFSAYLGGGAQNSFRTYTTPNRQMPIDCTAETCVYNQNGICHAKEVKIDGSSATKAGQTCCQTFTTNG